MTASTPSRRRGKAATATLRANLTPETWIEAATEVLVDEGIDHVRVDVLAQQLGVTRGSFYWHFRDREELLRSVLAAWRRHATEELTRRLEMTNPDPRVQLRDVLTLPFRGRAAARAARIELAIRAWARRDQMARYAVDEADASRLGYIAQLFSQLGFGVGEARMRAQMLYGLLVAESVAPALVEPGVSSALNAFVETVLAARPDATAATPRRSTRRPAGR
jgi:AcrR family transcriptional regulator